MSAKGDKVYLALARDELQRLFKQLAWRPEGGKAPTYRARIAHVRRELHARREQARLTSRIVRRRF